jgi:hypothetical protein
MMKGAIEEQLEEARLAVEGALANPAILRRLEHFGYSQKEIKEGRVLINKVELLSTEQDDGQGTQKDATKQLYAARKELHTIYVRHLSFTRLALPEKNKLWDVLKLHGSRKERFAGWIKQVKAFYNNIHRVQPVLEQHGITAEEIAQAKTMVAAIGSFRVQQKGGKRDKQKATKQRQAALKALQVWMHDFLYIARHALKDDKEQMEALGQVV